MAVSKEEPCLFLFSMEKAESSNKDSACHCYISNAMNFCVAIMKKRYHRAYFMMRKSAVYVNPASRAVF